MGEHPCAYDYVAAQVPSPLTEAMERGRREKVAERKRAQKKAKKQKEKVYIRELLLHNIQLILQKLQYLNVSYV